MFVDASAFCAILLGEPEGPALAGRLSIAEAPVTSPIAVFQTMRALMRERRDEPDAALRRLRRFMDATDIALVPIGGAESELALDALARYGKGRHPAKLNMGDCFAYAYARSRGLPLLCKGDDFAQTDIRPA